MNCEESKRAFEIYKEHLDYFKKIDLSESDTRSKLIDNILINVLGWNEHDIKREGHIDHGYYDYKISLAGFYLIIEAKKQFKKFILPTPNNGKCLLSVLYRENQEVIDQIREYLDDSGCDTGVITNGDQFIISKFINTNGIPWKQNRCIIFDSTNDIYDNFIKFWNCLSKESIIENKGIKPLEDHSITYSKTIFSTISEKDNEITRNDLSAKIAPLINKAFGEMYYSDEDENDMDFIRECYVENKEVIKNKRELNGLFSDNVPLLGEVVRARNQESITKQAISEIQSSPAASKMSPAPKPIIIIGSRGAGKTTFLNFLFRNDLSGKNLSDNPYLFVNLMKYYSGYSLVEFETIYRDLLIQFNDKYPEYHINDLSALKRIYVKEINEKDKGIWKYSKETNEDEYNRNLTKYLEDRVSNSQDHFRSLNLYLTREIHKRILVVFDNADQLSDEIQEQVYLNACSLNTKAKIGVFISLREGYYYTWRSRPPFNAFDSNTYHITAPDYGEVLQKRLNYIINKIKFTKDQNFFGNIRNKNVTITEDKIEEFFSGIKNSLFGTNNTPILDFLRLMSFPNIREGLSLFKTFLISGYTDVSEYVLRVIYNNDNHCITIPIHEFVKTIGLENKLYYNHSTSKIQNLFYPTSSNSDYFIKYYLLKRLEEQLTFEGNTNKTISSKNLVEEFFGFGYKQDVINQEIAFLLKNNFIETDKMLSDISWDKIPDNDFNITITAKGYYYISEIVNRFYYIDLVLQDTPIFKEEWFNKIKTVFPLYNNGKRDMEGRVKVVSSFIEYLNSYNVISSALQAKYGNMINNIKSMGLDEDLKHICNKNDLDFDNILEP